MEIEIRDQSGHNRRIVIIPGSLNPSRGDAPGLNAFPVTLGLPVSGNSLTKHSRLPRAVETFTFPGIDYRKWKMFEGQGKAVVRDPRGTLGSWDCTRRSSYVIRHTIRCSMQRVPPE